MTSKVFPSIVVCKPRRPSEPKCELDRAIHVKRSPSPEAEPSEPKVHPPRGLATMTPSERYALWKFEQKYRAYTAESGQAKSSLGDELYHDSCLHFMDGIPMNKSSIARFHRDLIGSGTKRRVVEFHVIDSTRVESVIHTRSEQGDLYVRCAITLKDGKIYRVEKMHSALPPPMDRKSSGAQAA